MRVRRRSRFGRARMNLTPMIDVVFLLVIFFVITVNFSREALRDDIRLSPTRYFGQESSRLTTVQVDSDGRYFIGRARYTLPQLKVILNRAARSSRFRELPVVVYGDRRVLHDHVSRVMSACAQGGLRVQLASRDEKD